MRRMIPSNLINLVKNMSNTHNNDGEPLIEYITDRQDHRRFIGDNGTPTTLTGVTTSYCKWSLSGTHLMVVLACSVADEVVLGVGAKLAEYALPSWVRDKIIGVAGNLIEYKIADMVGSDYSTQQLSTYFEKSSTGVVINVNSTITLNADRTFRVQFDLLID